MKIQSWNWLATAPLTKPFLLQHQNPASDLSVQSGHSKNSFSWVMELFQSLKGTTRGAPGHLFLGLTCENYDDENAQTGPSVLLHMDCSPSLYFFYLILSIIYTHIYVYNPLIWDVWVFLWLAVIFWCLTVWVFFCLFFISASFVVVVLSLRQTRLCILAPPLPFQGSSSELSERLSSQL